MCIKKGRPFFVLGEKREERSYSGTSRTSYWGSTILSYRHLLVFGCTCFVHILAQLREKLSSRQALVSFLDMLSPNIDRCYDVKSKRLDVSLNVLFNEVT